MNTALDPAKKPSGVRTAYERMASSAKAVQATAGARRASLSGDVMAVLTSYAPNTSDRSSGATVSSWS